MECTQSASGQLGKWKLAKISFTGSGKLSQSLSVILPLFLLVTALVVVLHPIWQAGFPWGSDSWGHLHRAHYMGTMIREHGLWDGFLQSAWMPDWYLGDPTRVYYPPLVLWLLGPLTALTDDVFVAYRIFVTAIFLILGISVYAVGNLWGHNRWAALLGAVLAIIAPYTLRTVFAEGNLARGVALLSLPWMIWLTERILVGKRADRIFFVLCFLWGFTFLAHVMQAAIFAVALGIYVLIRLISDVYIPLRRGIFALLTIPLGGALAAFYLFTAYSRLELANVPSLPESKIELFSINPSAILPFHVSIEAISIGILSLTLAGIIVWKSNDTNHLKAILISGLICIVLAFGPSGVLYEFVPLKHLLLPERFINVTAIFVPLLIATTSKIRLKPIWVVMVFAVIVLIEFTPASRVVHLREVPTDEAAIAQMLTQQEFSGRVAPLTHPNPTASLIFLSSVVGRHENVSGWALENTPHQDALRRLLSATTRSPEYLQRVLSLWNTDYIVSRTGCENETFQPIGEIDSLQLCERMYPSAFAQLLPENRMLVIGNNATSWLFAFPFASEGQYANAEAYSHEYLDRYSVIGLNRVAENSNIEAALGEWVSTGNTLIVDLSGVGSIYSQGYTLFGVHALPLALENSAQVNLPEELTALRVQFPVEDSAWVGATYYGLDEVVATLSYQGEDYPLLGYQNYGNGRVWFVGFNLFYLLDITEQQVATRTLVDYLLTSTRVNRDLELPTLNVEMLERHSDRVQFRYQHDDSASAVLSMTYFPRWQATLDDNPLPLYSHEHLVRLEFPPGEHIVTLTYQPYSWVTNLGFTLSAATLLGLLGGLHLMKRSPLLARADREGIFEERLASPEPSPEPEFRHEICPSCGYPHAIAGPPTAATYPFISIECPECGYKLNDLGDWLPEPKTE